MRSERQQLIDRLSFKGRHGSNIVPLSSKYFVDKFEIINCWPRSDRNFQFPPAVQLHIVIFFKPAQKYMIRAHSYKFTIIRIDV